MTVPKTLVMPSTELRAHERPFWERAEALAQQYVAGLGGPLSDEAHWGMFSLCAWPWFAHAHIEGWEDWNLRFDDAAVARIKGDTLVHAGIGPLEPGWEPDAVIDGVRDFVRWLGATGHADGEQCERICTEIEFARESWLLSISELSEPEDPADGSLVLGAHEGCPHCAADMAAAPFVAWLRDTTSSSLQRSLMGQALAITALDQLGLTGLANGEFYRLDMHACLDQLYANSDLEEHERGELAAVARAFATFLAHRCGLDGRHKRRMQAQAERWAATPLRASA